MSTQHTFSVRDVQAGLGCRLCLFERKQGKAEGSPFSSTIKPHKARLLKAYLQETPIDTLMDLNGQNWTQKVQATEGHLKAHKDPIQGACFEFGSLRFSTDLMEPEQDGWSVTEVRSIAHIRSRHYTGAAIVIWALEQSGISVCRYRLGTINTEWTGVDREPRFISTDVTEIAARRSQDLAATLSALVEKTSDNSASPFDGADDDWPLCEDHDPKRTLRTPSSLSSLYRVKKRLIKQLQNNGVEKIEEIPEDINLPPIAARQRQALINQQTVTHPKLHGALQRIERPTVYIDFEAIQPALPPWNGCRPFGAIPVQVSLHQLSANGTLEHKQWIATPHQDPRPELAQFLADHLEGVQTLVAYHATFEQNIISRLASFCSASQAQILNRANQRFIDLLPLVRNHVYHPDFRGRFNLKGVVQALLPDLRYDDLNVKRGDAASRLLEGLLLGDFDHPSPEFDAIRKALLEYCDRDTLVLVRLEALLRVMAAAT